ncbi:MAG TPA: hypothetical protein VFU60_04050 [Ktedonobacterales bacterium]|jgi:hypothetical protein|nr:hypothetical protein [Ktedonobacterales bacterium]
MNKTKKVAWHKHLKSKKKYDEKRKAARAAASAPTTPTPPTPRAGARR